MSRSYSTQTIKLKENSWVFMYTDGYYDQLGGENMRSRGMDLFLKHLSKAVKGGDDRIEVLKEEYSQWRKESPPIDDVLVVGFKL